LPAFQLSLNREPGYAYVVRAGEKDLDFSKALGEDAPTGTKWDPEDHGASCYTGKPLGTMTVSVLRTADDRVANETSVSLRSGHMACEPPFCEAE
jgi:hypothetical protein